MNGIVVAVKQTQAATIAMVIFDGNDWKWNVAVGECAHSQPGNVSLRSAAGAQRRNGAFSVDGVRPRNSAQWRSFRTIAVFHPRRPVHECPITHCVPTERRVLSHHSSPWTKKSSKNKPRIRLSGPKIYERKAMLIFCD